MTKRTLTNSVIFKKPFLLPGYREPFPAGQYTIETEEVLISHQGRSSYRQMASLMCYQPEGSTRSFTQFLNIDLREFEAAVMRDQQAARPPLYIVSSADGARPELSEETVGH